MLPLAKPIRTIPKPYLKKLDMNRMGDKLPPKNTPMVQEYKKSV